MDEWTMTERMHARLGDEDDENFGSRITTRWPMLM
jgi:hypothetical protein